MPTVMQFGLGLGLAGVAGVRTYLPLIMIGLLTRFSDTLSYRPSFKILASVPVLLLLTGLAGFELIAGPASDLSNNRLMITLGLRALGGAIVFAGIFGWFGTFGGLLFGAVAAVLSHLTMVKLRLFYGQDNFGGRAGLAAGIEETAAVTGTVLAVLLPWSSYFIWGGILFVFLKKLKHGSRRYRPESKARPWR